MYYYQYGGTAILIENPLPHYTVQTTPLNNVDYNGIVFDLHYFKLKINLLYVRYNRLYTVNDISHLNMQHQYALIAGDYNAHSRHWNFLSTSGRGGPLNNLISHHQLSLHAQNRRSKIPP